MNIAYCLGKTFSAYLARFFLRNSFTLMHSKTYKAQGKSVGVVWIKLPAKLSRTTTQVVLEETHLVPWI